MPAEPHVPEGADKSVRVFHAGRNYFAWRLILWGIANTAVALGLLAAFVFSFIPPLQPLVRAILWALTAGAVAVFVASQTVEASEPPALCAARELLQETRALRTALAGGPQPL